MSGFGLLGSFLPVPSYAALALVAVIGSTIVVEAGDFRAADIQVEGFSTVQALRYMDQLPGGARRRQVCRAWSGCPGRDRAVAMVIALGDG